MDPRSAFRHVSPGKIFSKVGVCRQSGDWGQWTEVRGREAGIGGRRAEDGGRGSEDGRWRSGEWVCRFLCDQEIGPRQSTKLGWAKVCYDFRSAKFNALMLLFLCDLAIQASGSHHQPNLGWGSRISSMR